MHEDMKTYLFLGTLNHFCVMIIYLSGKAHNTKDSLVAKNAAILHKGTG